MRAFYRRRFHNFYGFIHIIWIFFSSGFNDLKSELTDYLKKFAENGKVRGKDLRYICVLIPNIY